MGVFDIQTHLSSSSPFPSSKLNEKTSELLRNVVLVCLVSHQELISQNSSVRFSACPSPRAG